MNQAIADLEEVFREVFGGQPGDEPNVYADYDRLLEMCGKMRRAIEELAKTAPDGGQNAG